MQSRNFHLAESFVHGKQTKGLDSGVTTTTHYHQKNKEDFHFGVNQPKVMNQVQTASKYYKSSILRVPGNFGTLRELGELRLGELNKKDSSSL